MGFRDRQNAAGIADPRRQRFIDGLGLSIYDAGVLTAELATADYFESAVKAGADIKSAANWVSSELLARLNRDGKSIDQSPVNAQNLAQLISLINDKTISGKIAKDVFDKMWNDGRGARAIVEAEGLVQLTDENALAIECEKAVAANPKQVEGYKKGQTKLLGFFVGQVMKATQGKANPEIVNQILTRLLS